VEELCVDVISKVLTSNKVMFNKSKIGAL